MKALKIIWLFFMVGILNACTEDDMVSADSNGKDENAAIEIAISLDDLLPVNMNSRGKEIDGLLSQINDLNIRIQMSNNEKYTYIYCPSLNELYINGKGISGNDTYYIDGDMLKIHLMDIAAKNVKLVEVIANNGKNILNDNDWKSVVEQGDNNLDKGYCMMYGETDSSIDNKHDGQGALKCQKFTVNLKRTRAMLTVQLTGNGLKDGVSITPKKISLHNIPTQCTLLSDNVAATNTRKDGEVHDIDWGTVTTGKTVGAHDNSGSQKDFLPLYLFENMQGKNDNTSSNPKEFKYPKGCNSVAEAKNNKTHSYVEIEAEYRYEENGYLKNSGVIVYRFFLGENDYNDFNVKRNTYYRLTLNLKGFGGAREDGKVEEGKLVVNDKDLSWRVDMDIRDWGFEKDEYDFDAHATLGTMKVMGKGWTVEGDGTSGGNSFIKFWSGDPKVNYWVEPTSVGKCGTENGILYFFIQPWAWDGSGKDGFNDSSLMDKTNPSRRKITITLINGSDKQTVTFYQWKPITIENGKVYMERFEEDNPFEWGYQGKSISGINGTALSPKQMWGAIAMMPQSPAQVYCKEKDGYSSISSSKKEEYGLVSSPGQYPGPSGNDAQYCLPDMQTLQKMKKYCDDNPHSNDRDDTNYYQPLDLGEYWSVSTNNQNQTYFLDIDGQQSVTSERNSAKRVRAIYLINPYW
ncbi:DUF4906 domain-containing protein [Phocaeicola sp.]